MSDFFNYTFDIVNPDALSENGASGTSSYPAVASAAPSVIYAPSSYFYTDVTKVADAVSVNLTTDAFGPVSGSETTKYRVTSFIRSTTSDLVKVFAISDGQIFIQPQDGDPTRVNLIIKNSSNSYSPLKIKYFIYRGVNKADLIDGVNLKALNTSNPADLNEPELLKRLWKTFLELNPGVTSFPANFIGYDPSQSPETNIEELFCRNIDVLVSKGEHIGNFKDILGLDIVLDYGDYELEHQEVLFKLNLGYARKKEQVFDVSTVSGAVKQKRYKEHIHQFIDAAAFWGSHINCGVIKLDTNLNRINIEDIYPILKKYQTFNKIYIYVLGEYNRSFNYYNITRKIYGFNDSETNSTYGWPILIKHFTNNLPNPKLELKLDCIINSSIDESDSRVSVYVISPTTKWEFMDTTKKYIENNLYQFDINYFVKDTVSCSCFNFFYCDLTQDFPLTSYYNSLWISNIKAINNDLKKATIDRNLNINLLESIKCGAIIKNKLIKDVGKKKIDSLINTKERRLYLAEIKFTTNDYYPFNKLLNDSDFSILSIKIENINDYLQYNYGDNQYSIYRSEFLDNGEKVYSLVLTHKNYFWKKKSFFQLGITDEEFNKLIQDSSTQNVFEDSDNWTFILEKDSSFSNDNVRKFRLGINFENRLGERETIFPSQSNQVNIYTLDGMFFFSKEYSDFQEFYEEFSQNVQVFFRPQSNWKGEYGFDWNRIGDTFLSGDSNGTNNTIDRRYKNVFGHYYESVNSNIKKEKSNSGVFVKESTEYQNFLNFNYNNYPSKNSLLYSSSILSIYPQKNNEGINLPFPKDINGNSVCLTEIILSLHINVSSAINKLVIAFEKDFFKIDEVDLNTLRTTTGPNINYEYKEIINRSLQNNSILNIKIKCLKEFFEEKKINIISYENNKLKLAGECIVVPNSKAYRKEAKLVFINCKTDYNPTNTNYGEFTQLNNADFKNNLKLYVNRAFNQNLIDVKDFDFETLDLTSFPQIKRDFSISIVNPDNSRLLCVNPYKLLGTSTTIEKELHTELKNIFLSINYNGINYRTKYGSRYLYVFCINEPNYEPSTTNVFEGLSEIDSTYSNNKTTVLLFEDGLANGLYPKDTPIHELFHILQNFHAFENRNPYFTTEFSMTDNFMDYSRQHPNFPIEGTSFRYYQTIISKTHKRITNES